MPDRLTRYAPLTGIAGVVFFVVAFATGSEPAESSSSPAKVVHFYAVHRSEVETSSVLIAIAVLLLVLFATSLRAYLRRTAGAEGLAALVLAGAIIFATAGLLAVAVEYSLAHNLLKLTPSTVQAGNLIAQEAFVPILGGVFLMALASFLAILRGAALPRWLAWLALVIAVVSAITPIGFAGFLLFMVWIVIASVLMYIRAEAPPVEGPPPTSGPAPAQAG
ncbi:MAG TPA: hypothetical protein VLZ06_01340 [Solirubrobacteraceae bacterium]|nr:hypothetical protein [Solirubrobacteraceae bacterium]